MLSSISEEDRKNIEKSVNKIAKKHKVVGVCLYGSKAGGYANHNSDLDIIIVLEDYPYILKYIYLKEPGINLSALAVDRKSLEKDAASAFLGEFVIGRLLHIYEPLTNEQLFNRLERTYKKRVILEEILDIVRSTNILSTEILFPLEYVMFSKIKRRSILYPNALYSYYKTYTGESSAHNKEFSLHGYKQALKEILEEDNELLILHSNTSILVRISEKRIHIQRPMKVASLKLTKKLQEFSSYVIHAYAGRHALHHAVREAESKIRRHRKYSGELPRFMSNPKEYYWKLPEGLLIIEDKEWLDAFAKSNGFSRYVITNRFRLGSRESTTTAYTLTDADGNNNSNNNKTIVVKELAKSKAPKWTDLNLWSQSAKSYRISPLFKLGNEYKALRYIRSLGLNTPPIESVVIGKKIIVTDYIKGNLVSDIIKSCLARNNTDGLDWIRVAGEQIAIIHANKSTLGYIKPSNLIVSKGTLYFTGIEQFGFNSGDPVMDIIYFFSRGLDTMTTNPMIGDKIMKEFLSGYVNEKTSENLKKLAEEKYYIELFYNMLSPTVAQKVRKEIIDFMD